jgi:hypothetical protein
LLFLSLPLRSFDVDPVKRKETPDFYGYIPDGTSRTVIFGCMVMNGALLLLSRSFCAAMLMLVEKKYFIWYSAFDTGLYLLQKMLRKDFTYWIPVEGVELLIFSVMMRMGVKIITDYTGIVQFRGSAEMGGIYWSISMTMAISAPFAAVVFYFAYTAPDAVVMAEKIAWRVVCSLSGSWLVFFLLFLALMKKKYRKTFFDFETGNEWAMSFFLKGDTDAKRVKPLRLNKRKWKKIRPQMKEFVLENWERWEEEEPDFFTEAFKKRVPDDMLPPNELRRQKVAGGGQRRRSSLGEMMGGSVPERKVSASVVPFNEGIDVVGDCDDVTAPDPTIARLPEDDEDDEEEKEIAVLKNKGTRKGKR